MTPWRPRGHRPEARCCRKQSWLVKNATTSSPPWSKPTGGSRVSGELQRFSVSSRPLLLHGSSALASSDLLGPFLITDERSLAILTRLRHLTTHRDRSCHPPVREP